MHDYITFSFLIKTNTETTSVPECSWTVRELGLCCTLSFGSYGYIYGRYLYRIIRPAP